MDYPQWGGGGRRDDGLQPVWGQVLIYFINFIGLINLFNLLGILIYLIYWAY